MNDQSFPLPTLRARTNFVITYNLFHWILVGVLFVWGDPQNSLHSSMAAWSWGAYIALMAAFLFGVNIDMKNFFLTTATANNKS
jgi:hypothetical protein